MTVCCPGSSTADNTLSSWGQKLSMKTQPLLQPESPLIRRMKVSFPSGGGTGVGFSPALKRVSLDEQSFYPSQVKDLCIILNSGSLTFHSVNLLRNNYIYMYKMG